MGICCQKIPGDNSCLFHAVLKAVGDERGPESLRQHAIPDYLSRVPPAYLRAELPDDLLSSSSKEDIQICEDYKNWIKLSSSWGGSIEMYILSQFYYGVQICVVNVPAGTMTLFPEQPPQNIRIYILYNGHHYDCVMPLEAPTGVRMEDCLKQVTRT